MSEQLEKLKRTDADPEAGYDLGVADERNAVVKYLRAQAARCHASSEERIGAFTDAAYDIENGEHT